MEKFGRLLVVMNGGGGGIRVSSSGMEKKLGEFWL